MVLYCCHGDHVNHTHTLQAILVDEVALDRVMKSYEMMLDFYGMRMKSKVTGKVGL